MGKVSLRILYLYFHPKNSISHYEEVSRQFKISSKPASLREITPSFYQSANNLFVQSSNETSSSQAQSQLHAI
jgi:hypothetical protein